MDEPESSKPRGGERDGIPGAGDVFSRLPDDILLAMVSLLPTKDGGRTPAISPRWRDLWSKAPLNLVIHSPANPHSPSSVVPADASKIVTQHDGPTRRFFFRGGVLCAEAESWFHSRALDNLQELDIKLYPTEPEMRSKLPPSALRSSALLLVKICDCDFPDEIPSMNFPVFPLLKQLSLLHVSISRDMFHSLLSACRALESLYLSNVRTQGCLRVSSPTLRSIGFSYEYRRIVELVIEDAPLLVRLLIPYSRHGGNCINIRVVRAPKLEILGPLFLSVAKKLLSQLGISPASSGNSMRTVKVLSLRCSGHDLDDVLNIITWFPSLEKLYITFEVHKATAKKYDAPYHRLHPVECLQNKLKIVVLKAFVGYANQIKFAKFFILNARVLNKIEFEGYCTKKTDCNSISLAYQQTLLGAEGGASGDVKFEFRQHINIEQPLEELIHDLSVADPFRQP